MSNVHHFAVTKRPISEGRADDIEQALKADGLGHIWLGLDDDHAWLACRDVGQPWTSEAETEARAHLEPLGLWPLDDADDLGDADER